MMKFIIIAVFLISLVLTCEPVNDQMYIDGGLLIPYDFAEYNRLPDFLDVLTVPSEVETINKLGQVIQDFGLADSFGVALLHKHFDLREEEMVMEIIGDNVSTSRVESDYYLSSKMALPHFFRFNRQGQMIPLEFFAYKYYNPLNEKSASARRDYICRYNRLLQSYDFLSNFTIALLESNAIDKFGLMIRHRDEVSSLDPKRRTVESSSDDERVLRVKPFIQQTAQERLENEQSKKKGKNIQTYWTFSYGLLSATYRGKFYMYDYTHVSKGNVSVDCSNAQTPNECLACYHSCEHACQHACVSHSVVN